MSQNEMFVLIVGILSSICGLWALIKRPVHTVFVFIRGIFFILLLYGIELFGLKMGWDHVVAVNVVTACISAFLGVPGIILLYAVSIIL